MHELNLAQNIAQLRKRRQMTQEDLAAYMGVSKAAVSKWETGQSFPDIVFLPQLATYFGTSIDELMGYAPQLSKQGVQEAIARLRAAFAEKPFDEALGECHDLVRDYYSCYPLLAQMATLYMNHLQLAPEGDARAALMQEAIDLCRRVRTGSDAVFDIRQANTIEAMLHLMEGDALSTAELLEDSLVPTMGESVVLASAYRALGKDEKAEETLQVDLYQSLIGILNILPQLALCSMGNLEKLRCIHERTLRLIEAFDMDALYLNAAALHLSFASAYAAAGDADAAIDCLERYVRLCVGAAFPLKLHGDSFFDHVQPWFDNLEAGNGSPRGEVLVKQGMIQGVAANPALAPLAEDGRFKRIVAELEAKLA